MRRSSRTTNCAATRPHASVVRVGETLAASLLAEMPPPEVLVEGREVAYAGSIRATAGQAPRLIARAYLQGRQCHAAVVALHAALSAMR